MRTGLVYITIWNTDCLEDYQVHSTIELGDYIKSSHRLKLAEWIKEQLGKGNHRCIAQISILEDGSLTFKLIDCETKN